MPSLDTGLKNLIFQLNLHTVSCRVIPYLVYQNFWILYLNEISNAFLKSFISSI